MGPMNNWQFQLIALFCALRARAQYIEWPWRVIDLEQIKNGAPPVRLIPIVDPSIESRREKEKRERRERAVEI
jgi:hypothetical protein